MPDVPLTELDWFETDELHLVPGGANGFPQLFAKAVDEVNALTDDRPLTRAEAVALATQRNAERIAKAKYKQADRDKMAASGAAMKDGSYPIADATDLSNAIHAVGRGGSSHDAIRKHIIARAKALGLSDKIPDNWSSNGSMSKSPMTNAIDALSTARDEFTELAKAAAIIATPTPNNLGSAVGDPTQPGSPAWEAQDAAQLIAAGQQIARALAIVNAACDREEMEVATGHADDQQDVWDLQCATDALNCALGIVARISFTEEHEGMAKAKTISATAEDQIRAAVTALSGSSDDDGSTTNPDNAGGAVAKSTSKEVLEMEITESDLDERIAKASAEAVNKYAADLDVLAKAQAEADEKAAEDAKAAELAKATAEAEAAALAEKTPEEIAKATAEAAEKDAEELAKAAEARKEEVTEIVKAAVTPLEDKLDQLLAAPRMGGPKLMAPRGGEINMDNALAVLNDRLAKSTDPYEKADLTERLARAQLNVMYGEDAEVALRTATETLPR